MARTIDEIKSAMTSTVSEQMPGLSKSKVAEWRMWVYVMAVAIHTFEVILDAFRREVDVLTTKITPGTIRWYAEMCKRFQNGDSLSFDPNTALLYYQKEDPSKQIIEVAAVSESRDGDNNRLFIKVAKKNDAGKIIELNPDELHNFSGYIDAVKFAGCQTEIVSTKADQIQYALTVYHEPAVPGNTIVAAVEKALGLFKTSIDFDGIFYRQKFIDAVMAVEGVVTCEVSLLRRHSYQSTQDAPWKPVDIYAELDAGYFEYADGSVDNQKCSIEVKNISELITSGTNER